jgi:uncharacterized protein YjeT (DUF2065 family)
MQTVAVLVILATGAFLCALGGAALFAPERARRFLLGFATTSVKHALEMALRLIVGVALLTHAAQMPFELAFRIAGWVLLVTTLLLALVPWRWHQRFARASVPQALRFLPLLGFASLALGALLLYALVVSTL